MDKNDKQFEEFITEFDSIKPGRELPDNIWKTFNVPAETAKQTKNSLILLIPWALSAAVVLMVGFWGVGLFSEKTELPNANAKLVQFVPETDMTLCKYQGVQNGSAILMCGSDPVGLTEGQLFEGHKVAEITETYLHLKSLSGGLEIVLVRQDLSSPK